MPLGLRPLDLGILIGKITQVHDTTVIIYKRHWERQLPWLFQQIWFLLILGDFYRIVIDNLVVDIYAEMLNLAIL